MPKSFEHKEAKELIRFYRKLLNDLKRNFTFSTLCQNDLNYQIMVLHNYGFFSIIVEAGINGQELELDDKNLISFISSIYYYKESCKYSEVCKSLYNSYKDIIDEHINSLSSGSNAVYWLFSSKQKKSKAVDSYNALARMQHEPFTLSTDEVLHSINTLKETDFDIIKKDYLNNKDIYKQYVSKISPNVFKESGNVNVFKKYEEEYKSLTTKLEKVKKSVDDSINEIKYSVDYLLADELVNSLKEISVDELARDKSGIKTKFLKNAGYETLADVFGSSVMQIASIYGISQDKAYTIKRKCDSYANELKKGVKIKLSTDNKSGAATKVIRSIYSYLKKIDYSKRIDELNSQYGDNLKNAFDEFNNIGNGVKWPFMTDTEISDARKKFKYVDETLSTQYKPTANEIFYEFNNNKIILLEAWNDFASNSIKYYNTIEEVYPGVLGNDDSIYGLPEELAREIQDECLFPDGLLCTLRKYQEWGVKYILHQGKVLLGDEMGLGKTVQAIATMVSLKNTGATHFLVIYPASVVTNWCREITKHSKLKVTKIHGNGKNLAFKSWLKTGGVAITNFESTSHINFEINFKFSLLVVDEAHFIKNSEARRSINTISISNHAERLLFMTGTALENKVDEMITLINILCPSVANKAKRLAFMNSAPQFRKEISSVYYRRKREDVLTELPDKIETKEWCTLNNEEELIYENAILSKKYQDARRVSWNIDDLNKSCKALRLKEIVDEAEQEGRKVLVFSFFLDTIAKIHSFLKGKCLNPINGSINVNRRQEIIDEFNEAPAGTVLLAQINSGGTGLNIQSASVVVICEPQFKPSIENQAISRAYRMGQSRNVLVYRLLCENSIDEKLINVLEEKQHIFDTFADKSFAAQQSLEIDNKTFGDIIKEEIDRINIKRGTFNELNSEITSTNSNKEYYESIMKLSYDELVEFLINKYGPAKYDYFVNENCLTKNKKVSRTSEGLYCHHIDEDKAIMLSNDIFAPNNPFEYQKANRLVYCNFLEHLLLHILIVEKPKDINANKGELQGIGGAINFICKQLNDLYNGYEYTQQWMINTTSLVKDDYETYIIMLKRLWKDIQENKVLSSMYSKESLALGWNNEIYPKILKEL